MRIIVSNTNHLESKKELDDAVNKIIDDNLGSTIFMPTENYYQPFLVSNVENLR